MRYWKGHLRRADRLNPTEAAHLAKRAGQLARLTRRVEARARGQLLAPALGGQKPDQRHTWTHRPTLWLGPVEPVTLSGPASGTLICPGATLYHDCGQSALSLNQSPTATTDTIAPYGITLDTAGFTGSFASIALDLPDSAWHGLSKSDLVGLDLELNAKGPVKIFARANIRHGPNTDQFLREIDLSQPKPHVAFDLLYSAIDENRINGLWLDLIFEKPIQTWISIADCLLTRQPRANV